ncbi:MAG: adenosylcobinamide-GDP ribazoletransferase, partial [Candidatus Latescibacterota bacterium]
LFVGACGVLAGALAGWLWGGPLAAMATVGAWTVVTLGLHLDGLADTCDGLLSWRPRERKLEIMRDSRIGTMGALGLAMVLLAKIAALHALGARWWIGALLAPLWGRWADIYGVFFFPAAREGGLGRTFHDQVRRRDFALATAISLGASTLILFPAGALVGLGLLPLVHLLARRMVTALGGLTGDTYGALCELGETAVLLSLAALEHHSLLRPLLGAPLPLLLPG